MCPEQQNKGICKLTRCPYPHQTRTIKIEQSHIENPNQSSVRMKRRKQTSKCPSKGADIESTVKSNVAAVTTELNVKRYFDDDDVAAGDGAATAADKTKSNSKKSSDQTNSSENSNGARSTTQMTKEEDCEKIIVVRKPIVGSLPSFIPIG